MAQGTNSACLLYVVSCWSQLLAELFSVQVKAQDIAGSMRADKQNLRMEELDLLFQTPSFETAL